MNSIRSTTSKAPEVPADFTLVSAEPSAQVVLLVYRS